MPGRLCLVGRVSGRLKIKACCKDVRADAVWAASQISPRLLSIRRPVTGSGLRAFRAKAFPGFDPGWIPVRVKKTRQNKDLELRF
jgi:hypothetical protein